MSFAHDPWNMSIPSLNVSGDINFAYMRLDAIKKDLISYEASTEKKFQPIGKIQKDLEAVILVYNENVLKINYGKSLVKVHDFPTFEEWQKSQPCYFNNKTMDEKRADYNGDRYNSEKVYWAKLEVNYNLAQLAGPQLRLREKIEKLIQRANAHKTISVEQLPSFEELNFPEQELIHYGATLREPNSTAIPFDAIPRTDKTPIDSSDRSTQFKVIYIEKQLRRQILSPVQVASSASSTTPASPAVDVAEPVQVPQTHSVTIHCPLAGNQILGICQDPEWEKKPVPFTSSDHQNWKVELPRQHEFKYVIIEAGKDLVWEKRGNRCLRPDSSNSSFPDEAARF